MSMSALDPKKSNMTAASWPWRFVSRGIGSESIPPTPNIASGEMFGTIFPGSTCQIWFETRLPQLPSLGRLGVLPGKLTGVGSRCAPLSQRFILGAIGDINIPICYIFQCSVRLLRLAIASFLVKTESFDFLGLPRDPGLCREMHNPKRNKIFLHCTSPILTN